MLGPATLRESRFHAIPMRARVWAVLLLLGLAGCADPDPDEHDDLAPADVEVDDTTGAVSGVVVDEAIRPLAGARVNVSQTGATATTDEQGRFSFTGLAPGFYVLGVQAEGHLPVQATAQVEAGQVVTPRIMLPVDPSPDPYHDTLQFNGFIQVSPGIAGWLIESYLNGTVGDPCDCSVTVRPAADASTFVLEVTWDETVPSPVGHSGFYWELIERAPDYEYEGDYGDDPILVHKPAGVYSDDLERLEARFTGPDEWLVWEQDFEMFVTTFYHKAAPDGWSLVAGDI